MTMKTKFSTRLLMLLTMFLGALSAASASDRFYVDAVNIEPGETKSIAFNLDNSQDYFGFQADITLPEGLEIVLNNGNPDCTLSSRVNSSYTMVSNLLAPNAIRFGAFSTDHSAISGNSGALLYINVIASEAFIGGELKITNILFTNSQNVDVQLSDYSIQLGTVHDDRFYIPDFKIAVGETKTVGLTLDNETTFCAFQTDIYLPEGLTIIDNSFSLSERGSSSHSITAKSFSDGRVRIACCSTSSTNFQGNNGELFTFQVYANKDIAETCTIYLKNQIFSTTLAQEYQLPNSSCLVTTERALIEQIILDKTSIELYAGDTDFISATVLPTFASTKDIQWSSSNPEIVAINQFGQITAIAPGLATITASAVDGSGVSSNCIVTVKGIPVSQISLNRSSIALKASETEQLVATVLPANAFDKSLIWISEDALVAKVDETGLIMGVGVGETIIVVKSVSNPDVTASCDVTVLPTPVSSIIVNPESVELKVGETASIKSTVLPEIATDKTLTWTSDNPVIATVNGDGII